jgi:hypothetical protein
MLKIYDKLEDVPEALREHYKLIEGKYVAEVTDDHPIKLNNVKLLNEKTTAETKASGLETANAGLKADLESAKSHSLPRGHRAVPVAEVEAAEKLKEHGTAAEIVTKLTEHKTLSEKVAAQERETNLRLVAKELGYNADAFVLLPNLPDMEIREKDGKKTVVAKVKEGETVTEKPAAEFVEASYSVFLPSLKAEQGVKVLGSASDEGTTADPFKWAKDFSKDYVEQSKPVADPFAAFNQRQSA